MRDCSESVSEVKVEEAGSIQLPFKTVPQNTHAHRPIYWLTDWRGAALSKVYSTTPFTDYRTCTRGKYVWATIRNLVGEIPNHLFHFYTLRTSEERRKGEDDWVCASINYTQERFWGGVGGRNKLKYNESPLERKQWPVLKSSSKSESSPFVTKSVWEKSAL